MSTVYNLPLTQLVELLRSEPTVWVRAAAAREGDDWPVRLLEITTHEAPPHWRPCRWDYPDAVVFAGARKGATVAGWLGNRHIAIKPYRLSLEDIPETASRERRESVWRDGTHTPLPWPSEVWRIAPTVSRASQGRELIGAGSPSFASFDVAASHLLGVELTGWKLSGNELVVRCQDPRGRLAMVEVHPAELRLRVEGCELRGAVVELAGNRPGPALELSRRGRQTVRFVLEGGLPDGAWLVLREGDEWLDRRFLTWPYRRASQDGVEFFIEPATRAEVLISSGEGTEMEYKERLPEEDAAAKRKVMKTVSAFANTSGGTIVFGVSNDGEVVGLERKDCDRRSLDRLTNLVRSWVSPLPKFTIEVLPAPERVGKYLVVLAVEPGEQRPYAAGTEETNYVYYVRRGASSYAVGPSEVRVLARPDSGSYETDMLAQLVPRRR